MDPTTETPPTSPKPKGKTKAKTKAKKKPVKKVAKKQPKSKAKKKTSRAGKIVRSERLDMRLSASEKARVVAKAKKTRRTVTSLVVEAIEKIR